MAKNVTFEGADDGTRAVDLDGRRFQAGVTQTNVSDNDVKRLKALDGHRFKVEPAQSDDTNSKS